MTCRTISNLATCPLWANYASVIRCIHRLVLGLTLTSQATALLAEEAPPRRTYEPAWESLLTHPVPDWFRDAKFGIMIHWGPYSVLGYRKGGRGYAEWTPSEVYRDPAHYYPYLERTYGAHPPEFGYKDIVPLFKAERWDPEEWAELFQEAGAGYVVMTAEHHDGYALWGSDLTPWCATRIGPMRDLVGELGKAVRQRGLKFAPSYHRERHPGFFAKERYAMRSLPHADIATEIERQPEAAQLYGPFEYGDAFIEDYVARWKEIEAKYRPDFMWIDDVPIFYWSEATRDSPQTAKFRAAFRHMIADYFNAAEEWGREVYLNNKGRHLNWPEGLGCLERDNLRLEQTGPVWESPATLGTSYGYLRTEELDDRYKSPQELIHLLCDVVSKNGNLLLNIGPRADGTIPEGMVQRLRAVGGWLKQNGEAIYGTRPWSVWGQEEPDLKFTSHGSTLYAIALEQPTTRFCIAPGALARNRTVAGMSLVGSTEEIAWSQTEEGVSIFPPRKWPGGYAWVFRIVLEHDE